jgi:hypothetical protein
MARTTRQTAIFGVEDWKRIYETFREADFQSYDFETLRKSFIDYIRQYYPESFNDYIESSEFIALLDVIAFMGQAMAFRNDLNTRENYLDTAERRDSVVRLANLVGYTPKRNSAAQGYLKVFSVQTTENVSDFNGVNLSNITIDWNDPTNLNWQEQFTAVVNAALVSSQRIGRPGNRQNILNVLTDEYAVNLVPGFLPIISFNATVDGINMPFEVVSATSVNENFIYEQSPTPGGVFNLLFRNDRLGFDSANTGYFFYFKQGVLQNQDFNLEESLANRTVNINIEGINNEDHWLYQLTNAGEIDTEWRFADNIFAGAVEQADPEQRKIYSIVSRTNDQITLTFGDGVFSTIPIGLFRCFVRASNGLRYTINPEEMQAVSVPISYVSRSGELETITFTCGITQPVTNAQNRETLDEIKQRAPARYYTQNRMVNGEDYNNFPFTQFNSIIKSKAVNRSSIGTSRYLDLVDNTGKYSSTNSFSSDGALWEENVNPTFLFTWLTQNDIADVIANRIEPTLNTPAFTQFYYAYFSRPNLETLRLTWNQSTTLVNETTGFFRDINGNPVPVGSFSSNNTQYITQAALIKFKTPELNQYFDANNRIRTGVPTRADEKLEIWASPIRIVGDGFNGGQGNLRDGTGPIVLNNFVPTNAVPVEVIPVLVTDLPVSIENTIFDQIVLNRNFGLGYNNITATWYLITSTNLAQDAAFSLANAGSTSSTNEDASWLIQFITDGETYSVTSRGLNYSFGSVLETRFFFETDQKIFDSRSGKTISDFVKVLRSNSRPDSNEPLTTSYELKIVDQPVESDGFVDDYQVLVSFQDSDDDGVADDPDFFNSIVAPNINSNEKLVFFERTVDFDNLQRFLLAEPGRVISEFATKDRIEVVKTEFLPGQVFYAFQEQTFYVLRLNGNNQLVLENTSDWIARVGRSDLAFQYRHNAPLTARIDPGTTNIIDIYVVTQEYYSAYQNWIRDTTNTVPEPAVPTIDQLSTDYQNLQNFKMLSDNIIVNSVQFKPLFGSKASPELQATVKVIRATGSTASESEIKNLVVTNMNEYFTIDKWDFGSTFFFSELAAYIHERMGGIVSSVVLVPLNPRKSFGDLYEIRSAPNEIFVNAANVTNVEVITALTSTNIRSAPGSDIELSGLTVTSVGSSGVRQPRVRQPVSRSGTVITGGSTSGSTYVPPGSSGFGGSGVY